MNEIAAVQPPRMAPAHPGSILRDDVLPGLGVGVSEAERKLHDELAQIPSHSAA